jgi:hypothetical protein
VGWISTCCFASHPYHVSRAEVNWNQKTGNFEVALCLWPADLEKAISIAQGKPIDLDKVENLDELMKSYIEKKFLIRSAPLVNEAQELAKPNLNIRWVGHEKTIKQAWLYFEIKGERTVSRWTIENRIFFELNDDQMNLVELTNGAGSNAVICSHPSAKHLFLTQRSTTR